MERIIFFLLIFLAPSQLAYHFWPSFAYIFGIRVDYLAPAIYLTDILVAILFISWFVKGKAWKLERFLLRTLAILLLFAVLNIAFAESFYPALFKWVKVSEFFFLGIYITTTKELDLKKWIIRPLTYSLIFFSVIGVAQFLSGKTIGGPLYFLGERTFSVVTPGIALVTSGGREFLRVYSTFSHPNSMAAYLMVGVLLVLGYGERSRLRKISLLVSFLAIILTFSLAIYITAIFVYLFFLLIKKQHSIARRGVYIFFFSTVIISLIFLFFAQQTGNAGSFSETVSQRLELARVSAEAFAKNPLFGVGANNFLIVSRSLQPVHNIILLVLSETGVLGLTLFSYLFFPAIKNTLLANRYSLFATLLVVLTTGLVDHYWLTLQQNQLLLSIVFGLSLSNKDKLRLSFRNKL